MGLSIDMNHILRCHEILRTDIVRGSNCYLYDANGNKYVDFESGVWCTVIGHSHPRINEAIRKQIQQVMHLGYRYTNYLAEEAAEALLDTIDIPDGKCLFLSSGSESVEFAVQIAKIITSRKVLLTLRESYLAAYGTAKRKGPDEWISLDFDKCLICENFTCEKKCEKIKDIPFDTIGAFVFEPGSASGTVRFPPNKLIDLLEKEIRLHKGLVVVDEVTTGLGRTGKWYGFNHYALEPDIVVCGKGLGNGYPISAVAMKHQIADELEAGNFHYIQSHQNDPLGCAVAKEVIAAIKEEKLVERSAELGGRLLDNLRNIAEQCGFVEGVRGRGLMVSMQLLDNVQGSRNSKFLFDKMLLRGFLVGCNPTENVIRFLPSLTIEEKEIGNLAGNLEHILNETSDEID